MFLWLTSLNNLSRFFLPTQTKLLLSMTEVNTDRLRFDKSVGHGTVVTLRVTENLTNFFQNF